MNTSVVELNALIINKLKDFASAVPTTCSQRNLYLFSSKAFQRKRILTFQNVVMLIIHILKRTLSVELQQFFMNFSEAQTCSKQAFCQQRVKLKPSFFHDWNHVLVGEFYQQYGEKARTWNDLIVCAVDGSTIPLPQTEPLREQFGGASNQMANTYNVTARVCLVSDVLNGIVLDGSLFPYFSSEKDNCFNVLEGLDIENKLLIFDRGYPCYWLAYQLIQKGAKFIMRVQKNANSQVIHFLLSEATDVTCDWTPSYKSLKKLRSMGVMIDKRTPISIRMVKVVLETGQTEILITNLYDTQKYSSESLKEAYHFRWGIETDYGTVKEKLQLGQFSGIRQICIEQDFAADLFVYNLQSLIEKQTEPYLKSVNRKRKHCYKINKNVSFGMLKDHVVQLFLENDSHKILKELEKLFGNYLEPFRPGRKYPRIEKRRPHGKYYTLTNYKRAV